VRNLRSRLTRLADRLGPSRCPKCWGAGGQIQIIDVLPGEEPAEVTPCPDCGKYPFVIEVICPEDGDETPRPLVEASG
jgi:hypothetical protein